MPWRVVSTCTVDAGTGADATVTIHGQENFAISPGCNNQTSQLSENVQHSICDLLRRARVGDAPGSQPYHVYGASVQGLLPSAKPPKKEKTDRKAKKKDKTKHTLGFLHKNSSSSDSSDDESKHGGVAWACSSCSRQLHDATDVWALRCGHMFHAGCLDSACQTRAWSALHAQHRSRACQTCADCIRCGSSHMQQPHVQHTLLASLWWQATKLR